MEQAYKRSGSANKVPARFWAKVDKSGECWLWTAAKDQDGYGIFRFPWGNRRAHRVAYELSGGVIPDGMTLDHLCQTTRCVRPAHLEPVTTAENVRRSPQATARRRATHCKHGHPFAGDNLIILNGRRRCRACRNRVAREVRGRVTTVCSVAGCNRLVRALSLCSMHYARLRNTGEIGGPEPIYVALRDNHRG